MDRIIGTIRIALVALIIGIGGLVMLGLGLLPGRYRGLPLAMWMPTLMARMTVAVFNLRLTCTQRERLWSHRGFITPNHISFIDIIVLLAVMPVRFLSAAEVRERPLLGRLSEEAGAVFVDRSSLHSKRDAAQAIVGAYQQQPDPPIVIFAEGRMGTGDRVFPFSLGIFKMAVKNSIPCLPCAIRYDRPDIAVWHGRTGETLIEAAWRLATFRGPLHVDILPLDPLYPQPGDRSIAHANAAQAAIAQVMGFVPAEEPAAE